MKYLLSLPVFLLALFPAAAAQLPKPIAEGIERPWSVAVGPDGKLYVSAIGENGKPEDGSIVAIENGKPKPFIKGLDEPRGIAVFAKRLYVVDKTKVLRIDLGTKKAEIHVPANAFPTQPHLLTHITADPESGLMYVSDSGDGNGHGGAVYRITPQGLVSLVVDSRMLPGLHTPNGVVLDGASHLLLVDGGTGILYRIKLANGTSEKLADGLGGGSGLAWDLNGRLYISDSKDGRIFAIPRPGETPVLLTKGVPSADICMDAARKNVLATDPKAGTIAAIPTTIPGWEIDESPLPAAFSVAFPDLKWTGWSAESDTGKVNQLRPIFLTHAGDGSNRIFVPTQQGVIHAFPNDQGAKQTTSFLDIQSRVKYNDFSNEEGFLGLAFHPKYKENGEFFVFYTQKKAAAMTNVVSRFRVSKDDPNKADPASEEELIRFDKPFWNHDGGTICFGPDGYLYITHGDGGAGNDLYDNGQSLSAILGKILRIDVNAKSDGKNYSIPKDNPFVGVKDARGEIFAYGLRNIWRMAFDRKTGDLWAADVGQNLYEEIDIIRKGGNFGWNRREGLHPFGALGMGPRADLIDPIWEYHHDVGKSLTGGSVYRGTLVPEADGYYIYGDYVAGTIWGLKFDFAKKRAVANRPIKGPNQPVYSFGEDDKGELYMLTATRSGRGIYRLGK